MRKMIRSALATALVFAALPMAARAQDSQCSNLRFRGNFRLNGAMQHLGQADSSNVPATKQTRATNAKRVLNEAAQAGGVDMFTLWFMFGRVYAIQNDLDGADSAFTRAAALSATDTRCLNEILRLRKNMWVPLQQQAVDMMQAQNYDSALALLRTSHRIYRDDPSGYLNMASAFMSRNQEDSAAAMFRLASKAGNTPDRADLRATAAFNAARLLQRINRLPSAESVYREYLVVRPRDVEAKGSLAALLTQMNRTTEAAAIYDTLMANPDSLDSFGLFAVGVALFRQGQQDTLPANAVRRRQAFGSAARAFELGLTKNPHSRDALFNLTNAYLAADDTARVLNAAERLVRSDSMNRQVITLLARAIQMNRRPLDVVTALMRRDSLPFEVAIVSFRPGDSTAMIRGAVQNLRSGERPGFNLAIEFLNAAGEVVATERVDVPTLGPTGNPGSVYDFNLTVSGRGILAYRYKIT